MTARVHGWFLRNHVGDDDWFEVLKILRGEG